MFACNKSKKPEIIKVTADFSELVGAYIGNVYQYSATYDINHHTVEQYDTLYGKTAFLEINVDQDLIKFGGEIYTVHPQLSNTGDLDTIHAQVQGQSRNPTTITLVKSKRIIIYKSIATTPVGGLPYFSDDCVYIKK